MVTGASRGIGLAVVRALLDEGVRVVGAARTISEELRDLGVPTVTVDLGTPGGPGVAVERALAELGGLDLLVNNVGGGESYAFGGFLSADDAAWQRAFELNFFSAVRASRAALPSLIERGGTIVNVSTVVARAPGSGTVDYAVPKAALSVLGKALDEEFGPRGVRVVTVSPGPVRTGFWDVVAGVSGTTPGELLAGLPKAIGMTTGRIVEPEEVAAVIAFLASEHARSVAGSDHLVDGGAVKTW